jgi:Asp-tRNA(Asn)/Glu-tRNA(Gln) amidotransferase A subunit family amidase
VRADSDTEVVERIKAAGFLLVGKSNAPENGWSLSTEPKLYGATLNSWREGMTAGGSSGGAAAAVASRMVPIAEATDAAESIRVPASCCGVVGLRPMRGRLRRVRLVTSGMAALLLSATQEPSGTAPLILMRSLEAFQASLHSADSQWFLV